MVKPKLLLFFGAVRSGEFESLWSRGISLGLLLTRAFQRHCDFGDSRENHRYDSVCLVLAASSLSQSPQRAVYVHDPKDRQFFYYVGIQLGRYDDSADGTARRRARDFAANLRVGVSIGQRIHEYALSDLGHVDGLFGLGMRALVDVGERISRCKSFILFCACSPLSSPFGSGIEVYGGE